MHPTVRKCLSFALLITILFSAAATPFARAASPRASIAAQTSEPVGGWDSAAQLAGITAQLTFDSEQSALGQPHTARLDIVAHRDIGGANISFRADSGLAIAGLAPLSLPAMAADSSVSLPLTYTVTKEGEGAVDVLIETFAAAQPGSQQQGSAPVRLGVQPVTFFVLASSTTVFHGLGGLQALRVKQADAAYARGELDLTTYNDTLWQIQNGGADITANKVPAPAGLAPNTTIIEGSIKWTDTSGGFHPARLATVEIYAVVNGNRSLMTTVQTSLSGGYSSPINVSGPLNVFIRVVAQNATTTVKNGLIANATAYGIDSPQMTINAGEILALDFTVNTADFNHQAFSIFDAMVTAQSYVATVRSAPLAAITVLYPGRAPKHLPFLPPFPTTFNYYSGDTIHVTVGDWQSWDILLHEYGHHVTAKLGMTANPGGTHYIDGNAADVQDAPQKNNGVRLAWDEGWSTYFSMVAQKELNTAAWNIPYVGDTVYTDLRQKFQYALEGAVTPIAGVNDVTTTVGGEDSELALQRLLWDLYDNHGDKGDFRGVALGDQYLWDLFDGAKPVTFAAAYQALFANQQLSAMADIGCILSEHMVAPAPVTPSNATVLDPAVSPTFTWTPNGTSQKYKNNQFVVELYTSNFTVVHTSTALNTPSYTIPLADWASLVNSTSGTLYWLVRGSQTNPTPTGPYVSCPVALVRNPNPPVPPPPHVPGKLDLAFVVDTSASMGDSLGSIQQSAVAMLNMLDASGADFRISVIDYRDFPSRSGDPTDYPARVALPFTANTSAIASAINNLSLGHGGDDKETVFSGLMTAYNAPWRGDAEKIVILLGDAAPLDPEPQTGYTLESVLAAARALQNPTTQGLSAPAAGLDSVRIYGIVTNHGSDYSSAPAFQSLAAATGGQISVSEAEPRSVDFDSIMTDALDQPRAVLSGEYRGGVNQAIAFDGSASYAPNGAIARYEWDFESDGSVDQTTTTPNVTHAYGAPFAGQITLSVVDEYGTGHTTTAPVSIGMLHFSRPTYHVGEGAGAATIEVVLDGPSAQTVTVQYQTANGTAVAPGDYTAQNKVLSIAPNQLQASFTIPVVNDSADEGSESLTISLSAVKNGVLHPDATATLVIDDNDAPYLPNPSPRAAEVSGPASIPVRLAAPASQPITLAYATVAGGTATADQDYSSTSGTITFGIGETRKDIPVTISDDTLAEDDETIKVELRRDGTLIAQPLLTIEANDTLSVDRLLQTAEGAAGSEFRVMLNAPATLTVTVEYATGGGTASAGSDYTPINGTLTFEPGETLKRVPLAVVDDQIGEGQESLSLTLSAPTNAELAEQATGQLSIVDNDSLAFVAPPSDEEFTVLEGGQFYLATVGLAAPASHPLSVDYATSAGTAASGSDYVASSGRLTFAPGETVKQFTVAILNDGLQEPDETILLNLSNPLGGGLATPASVPLTILASDPLISFDPASLSAPESAGMSPVRINLSAVANEAITVNIATSGGSATAGADYVPVQETISFVPGQMSQLVYLPIVEDGAAEPDETVNLTLSAPANAVLGANTETFTIQANDTLTFSSSTYFVREINGTARITVRLNATSSQTVTVRYATANGTAQAGLDYEAASNVLTFNPGVTERTFDVAIFNDSVPEGDETILLNLSNPTNAEIAIAAKITLTIKAKDTFAFSSATYAGQEENRTMLVTVKLSAPPPYGKIFLVNYATQNGTAIAGSDYTATSGQLMFSYYPMGGGETTKTFPVTLLDDTIADSGETFQVILSSPVNADLGTPAQATVTIADAEPSVAFAQTSYVVQESAGQVQVKVRLNAPASQQVSVKYITSDGTAVGGAACTSGCGTVMIDYIKQSGTLIFEVGQVEKIITVSIKPDSMSEGSEYFYLTLNTPVNTALGAPSRIPVYITDIQNPDL